MDKNRVIGKKNALPWHLPGDLKHFKQTTLGKPVVMGRKTYESIGKPLPDRENIVLTRSLNWEQPGIKVFHDKASLLSYIQSIPEVFIIGGEEIYKLFLPHADQIYLTEVDTKVENGDAFFPEMDLKIWSLKDSQPQSIDEKNRFPYRFLLYQKVC